MKKFLFALVLTTAAGWLMAQTEPADPTVLKNVRVTVTASDNGELSKIELIKADGDVVLVKLDDNTIANAITDTHFTTKTESPRYAISMSAGLVYQARTVLLVANGERKTRPVAESLLGEVTPEVPISYGRHYARNGGELIYVLDRVAAGELLANRGELKRSGIVLREYNKQASGRTART